MENDDPDNMLVNPLMEWLRSLGLSCSYDGYLNEYDGEPEGIYISLPCLPHISAMMGVSNDTVWVTVYSKIMSGTTASMKSITSGPMELSDPDVFDHLLQALQPML